MSVLITSDRLELCELTLNEAGFIVNLLNTPAWLKFIGDRNIRSTTDAEGYINKILNMPATTYYVVKLKDTQISLGLITLIQRSYLNHPDIGFAFLPEFEGRGYAYEAAQAVLQNFKSTGSQEKILATTIAGNSASIKLITKLGLAFEKTILVENEELLLYSMSLGSKKTGT